MFNVADMMVKREPFHTEGKQRVLTPSTPSPAQPLALCHHHPHRQTEEPWPPSIYLVLRDHPNSPLSLAFSPPSLSAPPLFSHRSSKAAASHPFLMGDTAAVPSPSLALALALQAVPTRRGDTPLIQQANPPITPYLEVFRTASILRWRRIAEGLKNSWRLSRVLACLTVSRLI